MSLNAVVIGIAIATMIRTGMRVHMNSTSILSLNLVGTRLYTVALSGKGGGKLRSGVELEICVPSDDTQRIQETHIAIGHILCELVEDALFPIESGE